MQCNGFVFESGYHIFPQDLFHGQALGMTLLLMWSKKRINADPAKARVLEDRFAQAGRHRELKHYKLGIEDVTKVLGRGLGACTSCRWHDGLSII